MASKSTLVKTPVVYTVGVDITPEQWTDLILKVGNWYAEWRPDLKEPNTAARVALEACLKGVKPSDPTQTWKGAELSPFATRVRMACRYDIEKMEPMRTAGEQGRIKKSREELKKRKKLQEKMEDPNVPDELRAEVQKTAKYGDDPRVFLSSAEHKRWEELKQAYITQFPELSTINAEAELHQLLDLLIVSERHRLKILQGTVVDATESKSVTDQIIALKKGMGIHPEQLAKRIAKEAGGTIGEVAARLESLPHIAELREKYFVEEMLQLFQMYHTPSPRDDMGGHQIDEVGLFSVTRCRTCHCAGCGMKNFVGLNIDEVEAHLVDRGALTPLEASEDPTTVTMIVETLEGGE